jgi:hypothetical protein
MATWFVAIAMAIQAGAVVFAALYAKGQLSELRESREQATRPFVVIDLQTAHTIAAMRVRNIGQTIARNVTFAFSPPLECTWDDKKGGGNYRLSKIEMFANGIPSLPPGQELSTLLDQIPVRLEAGLPNRYEVEISYDGPNGRRYTEPQTLSLETHLGLTRIERKDVHDVAKALEEIKREVKRWSAFGGGSGLRIVTEDDMRRRFDQFLREQTDASEVAEDGDSDEDAPDEEAA